MNDLLSSIRRGKIFKRNIPEPTTVKDLIESCGVPHSQVDLVLINGEPCGFDQRLKGNEVVSISPFFQNPDVPEEIRLQPILLQTLRLVADANLGKLAKLLLMPGFDTTYRNDMGDRNWLNLYCRKIEFRSLAIEGC